MALARFAEGSSPQRYARAAPRMPYSQRAPQRTTALARTPTTAVSLSSFDLDAASAPRLATFLHHRTRSAHVCIVSYLGSCDKSSASAAQKPVPTLPTLRAAPCHGRRAPSISGYRPCIGASARIRFRLARACLGRHVHAHTWHAQLLRSGQPRPCCAQPQLRSPVLQDSPPSHALLSHPSPPMNGRPSPHDTLPRTWPAAEISRQMTAMLHGHLARIKSAQPTAAPQAPSDGAPPGTTGVPPPHVGHLPQTQHGQHSDRRGRQQQRLPQSSGPDHLRGHGRVLSYNTCAGRGSHGCVPRCTSAPPSPASARSSRSNLSDVSGGLCAPAARGRAAGAAEPRRNEQSPVSRLHGHLPPTQAAMDMLGRAANALRARSAAPAQMSSVYRGLHQNGSSSSMSTGVNGDTAGGRMVGQAGTAGGGQITCKRGLTTVPLLMPISPKARRRRLVYKPYSVHAPRYRPQVGRKPQNSNVLRKQLMGKGQKQ